ncbi:MAG: MazG family protein, partial [Kineosporiaceae bacterium]
VAPGLLSWDAWQALRESAAVFAAAPDPEWAERLADAGVEVTDVAGDPVPHRAGLLVERAAHGEQVAWFGSPDGDPGLTDAVAEHLVPYAVAGRPPEVEIVTGAHDLPGSRLLDLVAVMDVLRSPGGCPWDGEQTHRTLLPYLLEETHEVIEAIESGDRDHLREELGDLLLQVVFHARIAEEDPDRPFGVDEVAAAIVAKLVHRHPHVFGGVEVTGSDQVKDNWEQIKAAEKGRTGPFEGIPATLPALARAQKMLGRLDRNGADPAAAAQVAADGDTVAADLFAAVLRASGAGEDAESLLRAALSRLPGD